MVDSTTGVGSVQNIVSTTKTQVSEGRDRTDEKKSTERVDQVEISEEALNLAQAQAASERTREQLEKNETQSLGLNPSFVDEEA